MLRLHRGRERRANVLRKLNQKRVDLFERAWRLLAELDGRDLLGDGQKRRQLEGLLCRANLDDIVLDVGRELRCGYDEPDNGEIRATGRTLSIAPAMALLL